MSVTVTSLGTNTTQITMSGETTSANFISALDTAITGHGWSQLDVSNQYYRVYQALNLDGTTYKNIVIQIDPVNFRLYTTSWQSWNSSTHVGTNEVWTYNRTGMMGYSLSNCDVIVMASSRWCVLQTFIRNQGSPWSGVFELMREANEDTATANYPCWCWTSSALVFTCSAAFNTIAGSVSLPMTRGGLTGQAAAINNSLATELTRIGAPGATAPPGAQLGTVLPSLLTYPWSSGKKVVQTARVVVNGTELHGRILGLKLAYNIGSQYNVASLTVDGNYNYSSSGTATNFWVLQGNPTTATTNVLSTTSTGTGYTVLQTAAVTGIQYAVLVNTGIYYSTTTGVGYIDASGASLGTPTAISGISANCFHIIYDGAQYVYVASSTGVYQINTLSSNAVVQITGTSSLSFAWLAWDGTYVWGALRTTGANQSVYQMTSSGTINGTYALGNASATPCDICADNSGNVYVGYTTGVIYKVTSTGTVSTFATTALTAAYGMGLYYNGQYLTVSVVYSSNNYIYLYQYSLGASTGTLVNSGFNPMYQPVSNTTYLKANIAKIGVYDVVTTYTNTYQCYLTTTLTGLPATGGGTANYVGLSYVMNYLWCDGNRALLCLPNNNQLNYYTNLFHPDETTNTYGRFLLAQ